MHFLLVFIILVLAATSIALPRGSHLPRTIPVDSVEKHEDDHIQTLPANRPESVQPIEMLQLGWDTFHHMRPQAEELFEYLQMQDLTAGLENLFLRLNPGGDSKAQFVRSEPIVDIEDDGNFTVIPPERPAS